MSEDEKSGTQSVAETHVKEIRWISEEIPLDILWRIAELLESFLEVVGK